MKLGCWHKDDNGLVGLFAKVSALLATEPEPASLAEVSTFYCYTAGVGYGLVNDFHCKCLQQPGRSGEKQTLELVHEQRKSR